MLYSCQDCSLKKNGCIRGEGSPTAEIVIITDRPAIMDATKSLLASGKAQEQISTFLQLTQIPEANTYRTCLVKGYVKPNLTLGIVSVRKCRPHLLGELTQIKPKVLILMGAGAYKGFKGKSTAGTYYFDSEINAWVVYSNHPMRSIYSGQSKDFTDTIEHFKLAKTLITKVETTVGLIKPEVTIIRTQRKRLHCYQNYFRNKYWGLIVRLQDLMCRRTRYWL